MRTVTVSTVLDAPADVVWAALQDVAAFRHVTRGLVSLPDLPRRRRLTEGASVTSRLRVLGVPFSTHRLTVVRVDDGARTLVTHEGGGPLRSWVHTLHVEADGVHPAERCRYTDRIEIDAGPLTRPVAAVAHVFYRLRQRRWRALAPVLTVASPGR